MQHSRHHSVHSCREGDILKELLSPNISTSSAVHEYSSESHKDRTENNEPPENEDMNLHLSESEGDDVSEDNFEGSPLVQKFRKSMERKKGKNTRINDTQDDSNTSIHKSTSSDNDLRKPLKDVSEIREHKAKIMICERCPLSRKDLKKLNDYGISGMIAMTRKEFEVQGKKQPALSSWSVTICDTCSPCKEAENVHIKESDKEIIAGTASRTLDFTSKTRKNSYETPVTSRTWSVANSVTPDLFDTSTATEEYSMNLSHLSANEGRSRKGSGSTSKVFDDDQNLNEIEEEGNDHNESDIENDINSDTDFDPKNDRNLGKTGDMKCTDNTLTGMVKTFGTPNRAVDDVMVLSEDEVAKLPKSKSPSPVFSTQTNRNVSVTAACLDDSEIKKEKEAVERNGIADVSDGEDVTMKELDWLNRDTPPSHKPNKVYSFKSKKVHASEKEEDSDTGYTDTASEKTEGRRSRSLSLSQKRRKRKSNDESFSSNSSHTIKRSRASGLKITFFVRCVH